MTDYEALTARESSILRLIVLGSSNADVAAQLILTPETVKWYLRQIYSKLNVHNRVQAVLRACEIGLVQQHEITAPPVSLPEMLPHELKHDTLRRPFARLPPPSTTLIGREAEFHDLSHLLESPSAQIITLHGPGGIGKTRLALELAWRQRQQFQHGVCWVSLAEVPHADALPKAILAELSLRTHPRLTSLDHALEFLHNKALLFVLDNFEHLRAGAGLLQQIAAYAPGVRLLVTSREALHLADERLYPLDGMDMHPVLAGDSHLCGAVRLFIQAAAQNRPAWEPGQQDLATILEICRAVNGNPLAILLAAHWLPTLSLEDIHSELTHNFDLLASDLADFPPRQRSMRAVLNTTWARMTPAERDVFMRLSVFRGGFTFNAARTIAEATPSILAALLDKAVLSRAGEGRYQMHDLLARYGRERLIEANIEAETFHKHLDYFVQFMVAHLPNMKGSHQHHTLESIAADFENIRAAWHMAVNLGDRGRLEQMLDGIGLFCYLTRRFQDDETLLGEALAHPPDSPKLLAKLTIRYELRQRRPDLARMGEALTALQQSGNPAEVSFGLFAVGVAESMMGLFAEAETRLHECLTRYRHSRDSYYESRTLIELAHCADMQQRYEAAHKLRQQAISIAHQAEDAYCQFMGVSALALGFLRQGDYVRSAIYSREAHHLVQLIGSPNREAWCLLNRGLIAFFMGDLSAVEAFATLAQQQLQAVYDTYKSAYALYLHGLSHFAHQEYDAANEALLKAVTLDEGIRPDVNWVWALMACEQGRIETAWAHIQEALCGWLPSHSPAFVLWALPVVAVVLTHEQRLDEGVQVAALCTTHSAAPRTWLETWQPFQAAIQTLRGRLAPEVYESAWGQGCRLDPLQVAARFTG